MVSSACLLRIAQQAADSFLQPPRWFLINPQRLPQGTSLNRATELSSCCAVPGWGFVVEQIEGWPGSDEACVHQLLGLGQL